MVEEKMLIKKEKLNLFQRINNLIKRFFHKEKNSRTIKIAENKDRKNNILNEMKKIQEILNLQKKYENGIIEENKLTDSEKEELIRLYKKQIKTLEGDINHHKKDLEHYKSKIMAIRNKTEI